MHSHHNVVYPLLSSLLAVFGSWTALDLFRRARLHDGSVHLRWILISAVAMGVSIWSMHFVAMLGFDPGARVSYDPALTIGSLALAMVGTAGAFTISVQTDQPTSRVPLGGLLMGLSIGGMHYVGMAALRTAAVIGYRPAWVGVSVVVAIAASTAALASARRDHSPARRMATSALLGAGIVAMHYTAMAAVQLTPTRAIQPTAGASPLMLAFGVAALTLLLLALAVGASLFDEKHALLSALRAGRLGYWELPLPSRRLKLSEEGRTLLGFAAGDRFDQSLVAQMLTPESAAARAERLEHAIQAASDYEADYELRDGRWLEVRGRMILDANGRSRRLVGTIQEVTAQREAFRALARSESRQRVLINELNHRVKNTLASIQSIAALTARQAVSMEAFTEAFEARLMSLSQTHNLLTAESWERAEVASVFHAEFGHYDQEQISLTGPALWLGAEDVLALGLIVHELATNAAKYGSLSTLAGRVAVTWAPHTDGLHVQWRERGGPEVRPPAQVGFGSRLIRMSAKEVQLRYSPAGFEADIMLRISEGLKPKIEGADGTTA